MLEKIIIFILFLGPLVFFHELGHFLFARLFGVRVEVFSIGFGPKIIKWKRNFTEYAISLIPLGGYVKMFGDDPLAKDEIPAEDRKYSFTHKGKWARFWIVLGGPLANFVLAYFIFFFLLISGEKVPEIRFGVIPESSILRTVGILPGDILKKINGKEVLSPTDFPLDKNSLITTITVGRNNQDLRLEPKISADKFINEFLAYPPILRKPIVVNKHGEMFALSLDSKKVDWDYSLDQISLFHEGRKIYFFQMKKNQLGTNVAEDNFKHQMEFSRKDSFLVELHGRGYKALDLVVKNVTEDSPAEKVGLKENDVLVSLGGTIVTSFEDLRSTLQKMTKESTAVEIWRDGELKKFQIIPKVEARNGTEIRLIGVYSSAEYLKMRFVHIQSKGFFNSLLLAFPRTWESFTKTVDGFKKLILKEVSLKNIGGPIAIGKVAADSFNTSLSYFFQIMALISVNLGIINLFPIPVLDGGHILFIFFEVLNRGPLSRRKMEIAQQFGLSILLLLMVAALFNDFTRFF